MNFILKSEILCSDEYLETPDHTLINLDDEVIARIFELHKALMAVKADYIEEYDYRMDFKNEDGEEAEFRADTVMLAVSKNCFYWKGYEKYGGAHFETNTFSIADLKKAMKAPVSELAKLVVAEDEMTQKIAEARLKEGKKHERKESAD